MTQAKRPGAGKVGSEPTGGVKGVRVGNTPAVLVDIDSADSKQRHTTSHGKVEFSSENFPVRQHAQAGANVGGTGQFEFQGTPDSLPHIQRERVPRIEVEDAKPRERAAVQAEKEQRKSTAELQDTKKVMNNPRNTR